MAYIHRRQNGTYMIRVYIGMKEGKRQQVSTTYKVDPTLKKRDVEREVHDYAALFEANVHAGLIESQKDPRQNMTFEDFVKTQYLPYISSRYSPNTTRSYENFICNTLVPSIGHIPLRNIDNQCVAKIEDYLLSMDGRYEKCGYPLSPITVKRYMTIVRSIIRNR